MSSIGAVSGAPTPPAPSSPPPVRPKDKDGDDDDNRPDAAAKSSNPQVGNNVNIKD